MKIFRVIAPFGNAIDRTKQKLFQPFSLIFFLKLAFIAWLANLAFGFFMPPFDSQDFKKMTSALKQGNVTAVYDSNQKKADSAQNTEKVRFEKTADHEKKSTQCTQNDNSSTQRSIKSVARNMGLPIHTISPLLIVIGIFILPILILCYFIYIWLISHGRVMFLHSLAAPSKELSIRAEWKKTSKEGNALFRFMLIFMLAILLLAFAVPLFILVIFLAGSLVNNSTILPSILFSVGFALLAIGYFIIVSVSFGLYTFAPILILRRQMNALPAFRRVWTLVWSHFGACVKYLVFTFLLHLAFLLALLLLIFITCCICCIWIAILYLPFLWAVVFLPFLVLREYFALEFARQFGSDYDLFEQEPPSAPPPETVEQEYVRPQISL